MTTTIRCGGTAQGIGPVTASKPARRSQRRWFTLLLVVLPTLPAAGADAITGTVMDAAGHPVAGAKVGTSFGLSPNAAQIKVQIGYSQAPVVSGSTGSFRIPADVATTIGYSNVLVAAGPDGSLGFVAKSSVTPNQIHLSEPARLTVKVVKRFGQHGSTYGIDLMAHGSAIGYGEVAGDSSEFSVPQGSVELSLSDSESITATKSLVLTASKANQIRVELQPTLWARNIGKPAPALTPTDVQNWPPGKSFATLRGKWVLVDFWATWCQPCVAEMPKLINFYKQHSAERSRFEIVAIHSPDGKSFSGIRGAYDQLTQKVWSGQSLPFPLVFDSSGATHKRWGVEVYPTSLLLDPSGQLVGEGNIDDLAKKAGL
jgi:thiol-disulfide isomerase/thioredoxin